MTKDIRFLLVFLIIVLAVLVWSQKDNFGPISNRGALNRDNVQYFTTDKSSSMIKDNNANPASYFYNKPNNVVSIKNNEADKYNSQRENAQIKSRIVDNILKNNKNENDSILSHIPEEQIEDNLSNNTQFTNPIIEDINNDRNYVDNSDQQALDELMKEVNTGNDLIVNSPQRDVYRSKSRSINSANKYRKVTYKDSEYRYDFNNEDSPSMQSQDELNSLYDNSLIFKNNEFNTNDNFKGFNETSDTYGNANLKDFTPANKQTAKEKVMSLYNSDSYLPNNNLLDTKLTKGFQILDNPVAVSNPNLIPVLKSIPVSSVSGSTRNSTYDIRSEPPNPKTVVSPFLNSTIMPDIYATNRGCL